MNTLALAAAEQHVTHVTWPDVVLGGLGLAAFVLVIWILARYS